MGVLDIVFVLCILGFGYFPFKQAPTRTLQVGTCMLSAGMAMILIGMPLSLKIDPSFILISVVGGFACSAGLLTVLIGILIFKRRESHHTHHS